MQKLIIVGGGGFSKEVAHLILEINHLSKRQFSILGIVDQQQPYDFWGIPYLGNDAWAKQNLDHNTRLVFAIGQSKLRKKLVSYYQNLGFSSQTLIHPSCQLSPRIDIGQGTIVCKGSTLTTDIQIGRHCIININCTIGHDSKIDDFSTLSPGVHLSGGVNIGRCASLGTGSVVLPNISIAENCVLGAGAVATKPLDANATYIGIPAKRV